MTFLKRRFTELLALGLAAVIWWTAMHVFWRPKIAIGTGEVDSIAVPMANQLERIWGAVSADHGEIQPMRQINPEWDFMGRTFFILGEANLALRVPERKERCLQAMDNLTADTIAIARIKLEH